MKSYPIKRIIATAVACVLFMLAAVYYAIHYNQSRLVVPMDWETYVFQANDLPMLLAIGCCCLFVLYVFWLMVKAIISNSRTQAQNKRTRRLDPRLGWLGVLGFLGFAGFWTYRIAGEIFPFCFFAFFGFFGFFYEGKMSDIYMDERFRENATRAQLVALKIGFSIMMLALILLGRGALLGSLEYTAIAVLILLSCTIGLVMFLSEYLLYRYDYDDKLEDDEDGRYGEL